MNDETGHRMGTTRASAHSANISGSSFGDNIRIQQAFLNIFFRNRRNPTVSPENTPSPAVQAQLEEKERIASAILTPACRLSHQYNKAPANGFFKCRCFRTGMSILNVIMDCFGSKEALVLGSRH
ncbi:hypothetical protein TsFJ059_005807 [Trichoderma semiorbis]|uniref:Uncharacterized protein n=1 Tax=Trichoderma semiorbis TaxID=1491008 RepID=A0A9P8KPY8_9HYPO|nr:hypothetical protein TsFJ059_005807 [Trichoderma semiorbis]